MTGDGVFRERVEDALIGHWYDQIRPETKTVQGICHELIDQCSFAGRDAEVIADLRKRELLITFAREMEKKIQEFAHEQLLT